MYRPPSCTAVKRAEDVRSEILPDFGILPHQLPCPIWVTHLTSHDLDETRGIWIARRGIHIDLGAVVEFRLAVEQLCRLGPPLTLFRTVAVALGLLLRSETRDHDQRPVIGHAGRTTQPPGCVARERRHPPFEGGAGRRRVADVSLDDLCEHDGIPPGVGPAWALLGTVLLTCGERQPPTTGLARPACSTMPAGRRRLRCPARSDPAPMPRTGAESICHSRGLEQVR